MIKPRSKEQQDHLIAHTRVVEQVILYDPEDSKTFALLFVSVANLLQRRVRAHSSQTARLPYTPDYVLTFSTILH